MAKKASKSRSSSSAASSASFNIALEERKMALRIKSNEVTKRSTLRQIVVNSEIQSRLESGMKPKINAKRNKKRKKKKKNEKFDAKKPKKPPTAFFYFLEDFRKDFQERNPDVKSMHEVGKACGEKWKTMTYEEKVKYYDIATEKRAEFDIAMVEYIKKKRSFLWQEVGKDEEESTDVDAYASEFDE